METTQTRIKNAYGALKTDFGYTNVMQAPKVEKVVVSVGTGRVQDKAKIALIQDRLAQITGQKPSPRPAKQSIASFKLREGDIIGYQITLRGARMMHFLDKLINLALPQTRDFRGLKVQPWLPGLFLIALALVLHVAGYLSQQTRISLAAFYFGLYALIGLVWGFSALRATFFPMCLFVFALPLGTLAETITFPLRLLATTVTGSVANTILGINVVHRGTLLLDPSGAFQYEVAAACGGLRSLTAVLALCTIFGFMNFKRTRNRLIMIIAGFPLAILGNISRLLGLIIISEAFGQEAGMRAHDNTWFSLLPYIPPIVGIVLIGHWLREHRADNTVEKSMVNREPELQPTP